MKPHHLTPEQINQAIAESCGLPVVKTRLYGLDGELYDSWSQGVVGDREIPFPNYHGDLNACREALLKLPEDLHHEYHRQLYIITKPTPCDMWAHNWAFLTAGPEVVCEALLKTIGKIQ